MLGCAMNRCRRAVAAKLAGFVTLLAVLVAAGCADAPPVHRTKAGTADFRIATYNVHYLDLTVEADEDWGLDNWKARRGGVAQMVAAMQADIVAFQELETYGAPPSRQAWRDWLLRAHPQYRATGLGNGVVVGQPIFYRPGKFQLLADGHRFFNEPGGRFRSIRAIAGYSDAVTWARFRHRASGQVMTVFNVHLHFLDTALRLESTHNVLALVRAAQVRGDTVLVVGDFNARRNSRSLRLFYEAGFHRTEQQGATFHFGNGSHLFGAIDHMLYGPGALPVGRSVTERRKVDGLWPSDHYPVWTDFRLVR